MKREVCEGYEEAMAEWLKDRPEAIQQLARDYPPDKVYKLNENKCTIIAYCEDGTVRFDISSKYNEFLFMERQVFGVDPKTLKEVIE